MSPDKPFTGCLPGATTSPAPAIEPFLPAPGTANRRALVIFPGGGYNHLAQHEGRGYADWYQQYGYACFVVSYRLGSAGHRHPAMLEDAAAALHTVRARAAEFGVDPRAVGVVGSSAGGHLAASLMVHHARFAPAADCRPDFGILCYPVISFTDPCAHTGSRDALLGPDASPDLLRELSCELQAGPATPPCFLWHTAEDSAVPARNSLLFAEALFRAGVPCELHVYPTGRHGLGLNTGHPWAAASLRFIDALPAPAPIPQNSPPPAG